MTKLRTLLLLCLAGLLAVPVDAAAQCGDVQLTFDAATSTWSVANKACQLAMERDVNGRPTLFVSSTQPVTITVVNANPLLYSARFGDITLEAVPFEKALGELFLLVGGLAKTAIAAAADPNADPAERTVLELAIEPVVASIGLFEQERAAIVHEAQIMELSAKTADVRAPTKLQDAWNKEFKALRKAYEEAIAMNPKKDTEATLKSAKDLLTNEVTMLKAAASFRLLMRPICLASGSTDCEGEATAGRSFLVKRELHLAPIERETPWNRIATYPLKVTRDTAIAELVATPLPKEIATSLKLAPVEASTIDFQVGLLTTTIDSPTWAAVADPTNPSQKLVTRTKTDRYNATPALIGSWAFTRKNAMKKSHFVAEFGASLDTSKPAWFAGFGRTFGSILRIGVGGVLGRVNALEDPKDEDKKVVENNDAIKTKKGWSPGVYWSVSISLGGLPFFSK